MNIKVCGLRNPENIAQIAQLEPEAMGFIFYPKSPRYADPVEISGPLSAIPQTIRKVGVFVNESLSNLISIGSKLNLDVIQLHGDEDPLICKELKTSGFEVWKAIGVDTRPAWKNLQSYLPFVDSFLFDTDSRSRGGSGTQFDHQVLSDYPFEKPFLLSGGIGPEFRSLPDFFDGLPFWGLDLNSRFETEPGKKDLSQLRTFFDFWRNDELNRTI